MVQNRHRPELSSGTMPHVSDENPTPNRKLQIAAIDLDFIFAIAAINPAIKSRTSLNRLFKPRELHMLGINPRHAQSRFHHNFGPDGRIDDSLILKDN